ncbi:MAG: hypothetical protein K0R65_2675 [Crocinitomicaceae bacterium]|jgi:hypothetical protein|nr:hypothetical protein [Crocinitomicaceae bacterium]
MRLFAAFLFSFSFCIILSQQDSLPAKKLLIGTHIMKSIYQFKNNGHVLIPGSNPYEFVSDPINSPITSQGFGLNLTFIKKRLLVLVELQGSKTNLTYQGRASRYVWPGHVDMMYPGTVIIDKDNYTLDYVANPIDMGISVGAGYRLLKNKIFHITPILSLYYRDVIKKGTVTDYYSHYEYHHYSTPGNPGATTTTEQTTYGKATEFIPISTEAELKAKITLSFAATLFSNVELKLDLAYLFPRMNYFYDNKSFDRRFYQYGLGLAYHLQ